jgi:predicted type IV restriction endonuclease
VLYLFHPGICRPLFSEITALSGQAVGCKIIRFLVEVKAVSVTLNDSHIKQALDYGANAGVNWVILTNAETWMLYKIKFGKPIDKELVSDFNLLNINPKADKEVAAL